MREVADLRSAATASIRQMQAGGENRVDATNPFGESMTDSSCPWAGVLLDCGAAHSEVERIMRKLVTFVAATSLALAMLATQAVPANATTVVGRINGGGTSVMTDLPPGMGVTSFGFEATLYSDGSARGQFDCVDQMGDVPGYPGNIFGAITSWSRNSDGTVSLHVTDAKLVMFGSGLVVSGGLPFTVTIQVFGGPGVGHWTLDVPGVPSPFNGGPICQELMTSGQVVVRWN